MTLSPAADRLARLGRKLIVAPAFVAAMGPAHAGALPHEASIEMRNKTVVREGFEKWRGRQCFCRSSRSRCSLDDPRV